MAAVRHEQARAVAGGDLALPGIADRHDGEPAGGLGCKPVSFSQTMVHRVEVIVSGIPFVAIAAAPSLVEDGHRADGARLVGEFADVGKHRVEPLQRL